jgi:hypothetical protein
MVPAVAIEVPTDVPAAIADAALASCQNAIGAGRCVLSDDNASTTWHATITGVDGEPLRLRIEFRSHAPDATTAEKILIFSEHDDVASRWASAGLVIAGLVAAEESAPKKPIEHREPDAVPPPPASVSSPPPPPPDLHSGIDAGGLGGPGLQHGAYRFGGFARGWIASNSGVIAGASVRYAARGGDASLTWWSISAGVGGRLGSARSLLHAELVGELVAERMAASATDPAGARTDQGGQNRFGGRLGASASVKVMKGLRFLLGADTSALTPQVDIAIKNVVVGREPPLRFSIFAGIRLEL